MSTSHVNQAPVLLSERTMSVHSNRRAAGHPCGHPEVSQLACPVNNTLRNAAAACDDAKCCITPQQTARVFALVQRSQQSRPGKLRQPTDMKGQSAQLGFMHPPFRNR